MKLIGSGLFCKKKQLENNVNKTILIFTQVSYTLKTPRNWNQSNQ